MVHFQEMHCADAHYLQIDMSLSALLTTKLFCHKKTSFFVYKYALKNFSTAGSDFKFRNFAQLDEPLEQKCRANHMPQLDACAQSGADDRKMVKEIVIRTTQTVIMQT